MVTKLPLETCLIDVSCEKTTQRRRIRAPTKRWERVTQGERGREKRRRTRRSTTHREGRDHPAPSRAAVVAAAAVKRCGTGGARRQELDVGHCLDVSVGLQLGPQVRPGQVVLRGEVLQGHGARRVADGEAAASSFVADGSDAAHDPHEVDRERRAGLVAGVRKAAVLVRSVGDEKLQGADCDGDDGAVDTSTATLHSSTRRRGKATTTTKNEEGRNEDAAVKRREAMKRGQRTLLPRPPPAPPSLGLVSGPPPIVVPGEVPVPPP